MTGPLLEVSGLSKTFAGRRGWFAQPRLPVAAVSDVAFTVRRGETLGIVGESGSGKSTTARLLMRLIEPSSGSVRFAGEDLLRLDAETLRRKRRGIQMVFQDPFSSLNPRLSVGEQVGEPLRIHNLATRSEISGKVARLFAQVGLDPERLGAYPHEFSGGQRQRVAIARALAAEPQLIIADEAVSALDVSVRAQILNLFDDLKRMAGIGLIFISHDLAVVRHLVDRILVMYRGRIIETGPTTELFTAPRHPYTRALLAAMPMPRIGVRRHRFALPVSADATETAAGCPYRARCPLAVVRCGRAAPVLEKLANGQHSACFRAVEVEPVRRAEDPLPVAAATRLKRLQARFLLTEKEEVA